MQFLQRVKKITRDAAGRFFGSSDKSRKYHVRVLAKITSRAKDTQHAFVVFALPPVSDSQSPISTPVFSVKRIDVGIERRYRNRYAVVPIIIASGETLAVEQTFSVATKPFFAQYNNRIRTDDYSKLDSSLRERYLAPSRYLPSDDNRFRKLAAKIGAGEKNVLPLIKRYYDFVLNNLTYGNPIQGLYSAYEALARDRVDCGGYATLLGTLCICSGIPVRVVSGFFAGYSRNTMHAWIEVLLPDGHWLPLDPSTEALRKEGRTRKPGGFGQSVTDRVALSFGAQLLLAVDGRNYEIDILQHPRVFPHAARAAFEIATDFITKNV